MPITTQNELSVDLCGNPGAIDTPTRLRWHSCSPGALIGYSGEISELPQARSDEDTAEKFARRGSEPSTRRPLFTIGENYKFGREKITYLPDRILCERD